MPAPRYEDCVFLNVPFDSKYEVLLRALVFTIHDCGFAARCAREIDDGGQVRLDKIYALIRQSKYGVHDLSRTSPDRIHRLPRFNMPLELGIFLGAKTFGSGEQRRKGCLILDRDPYRYMRFCSDLAGHDIRAHANRVENTIRSVRHWLSNKLADRGVRIPSPSLMITRYKQFKARLPAACRALNLDPRELIFREHQSLVVAWLQENPWSEVPAATARPRSAPRPGGAPRRSGTRRGRGRGTSPSPRPGRSRLPL